MAARKYTGLTVTLALVHIFGAYHRTNLGADGLKFRLCRLLPVVLQLCCLLDIPATSARLCYLPGVGPVWRLDLPEGVTHLPSTSLSNSILATKTTTEESAREVSRSGIARCNCMPAADIRRTGKSCLHQAKTKEKPGGCAFFGNRSDTSEPHDARTTNCHSPTLDTRKIPEWESF